MPLILGENVSDWFNKANNTFEAAKAAVFVLGVIAFLVFAFIGYVATGGLGGGLSGFLRFLGLG